MPAAPEIPDVIGLCAAEAESSIREKGFVPSILYTRPPDGQKKTGSLLRVIRQRFLPEANVVEITVAPESWD
ncbi:MAG TPA: hypothetical protein GX699_00155 [Firmicutes bacterium]|nr:hypothetical protein [Bacillota bacterium]